MAPTYFGAVTPPSGSLLSVLLSQKQY